MSRTQSTPEIKSYIPAQVSQSSQVIVIPECHSQGPSPRSSKVQEFVTVQNVQSVQNVQNVQVMQAPPTYTVVQQNLQQNQIVTSPKPSTTWCTIQTPADSKKNSLVRSRTPSPSPVSRTRQTREVSTRLEMRRKLPSPAAMWAPETMVTKVEASKVGQAPLSVELVRAGRVVSKGLCFLNQAPFTPSVFHERGAEHYVVPGGWGVLRSRGGILIWLELMDDSVFKDAVQQGQALASGTVYAPPQPIQAFDAGQFLLQLAGQNPMADSENGKGSARKVDVTILGKCEVEGPIRIPCQDVAIILPKGTSTGLWANLGSPGSSFDDVFNSWVTGR